MRYKSGKHRKHALCHPERTHEAFGLCKRCYEKIRPKTPKEKETHRKQRKRYKKNRKLRDPSYRTKKGDQRKRRRQKEPYSVLRQEFLEAYGSQCSCCGEIESRFLTLEHINRDGRKERRRYGGNWGLFKKLKSLGWPKESHTIFCMNCNWATRFGEPCPHTLAVIPRMSL